MNRNTVLVALTALLYAQAIGCGTKTTPQQDLTEARTVMAEMVMARPAQAAAGDWIIVPLDAAQTFSLAFEVIASNDSTAVRWWPDGQSWSVDYRDTDGTPYRLIVQNLYNYDDRANWTHTLIWDRPDTNADGTPLVDFDGLYRVYVDAEYEVWDAGPDSASMTLTLPRADYVTATVRAVDRNGNMSEPSNTLVVRQEVEQ